MRVLFERGSIHYIVCEPEFKTQYIVAVNGVNVWFFVMKRLNDEMKLPKPKRGGSFRKNMKLSLFCVFIFVIFSTIFFTFGTLHVI